MSRGRPRPRHVVTTGRWVVDTGMWVTCFICRDALAMVGVPERGFLCSPCARAAVRALDEFGRKARRADGGTP